MFNIFSVLWIRNDLFRIRFQLQIFRVPDPTNIISVYLEIILLPPIGIYFSDLSFLPNPDPKQIIPDPDLIKSSGSDRIRIHNTA